MSSVKTCLSPALRKKLGIPADMPDAQIDTYIADFKRHLKAKKRQAKMQVIKEHAVTKQIMEYRDKDGNLNPKQGLEAFVYRDRREQARISADGKGYGSNLDSRVRATNAFYQKQLYEIMEELRPKIAPIGSKRKLNEGLVKALFNDDSGDPRFKKFAKQWRQVSEAMRQRFNRAGGEIKNLDDWNLPQRHDATLLQKHGYDEWKQMILDNADLERMGLTSSLDQERVLRKMYDNIVRDGWVEGKQISAYGMSSISNRHQQQRLIHFKDADSWLTYNEKYSPDTAYGAMMDHVNMMSQEIALMEALGPNPSATFDSLAMMVNKEMGNANAADVAMNAYANVAGRTHPHNVALADTMESIRNFTSFVKLPLAVISAPPDLLASAFTSHYNGIPAVRQLMTSLKTIFSSPEKNRKLAADLMMELDFMIDEAHSAARYFDVGGTTSNRGVVRVTRHLSSFTVKAGGLNHWTVANKMGFHFSFMRALADPDLANNGQMMKTFARYGLDENDLEIIVNSAKMERNGTSFLDPNALPQDVAEKVAAMVNAETKIAVPEADARVRGLLNQGTQRGTVGGEALRVATMFKTFPTSMIMNQWARLFHGTAQSGTTRLATMASLFVGTTIMGAGIIQLKRMLDGKREVPWDSPQLWKEAMIQGGTLSIMGDVFASEARTYGSIADFIGGPALGMADKLLWRGVLGTIDEAKKSDRDMMEIARELPEEAGSLIPQIAPVKIIWQRYTNDEIKRMVNPNHDRSQRERRKRNRKEFREYQQSEWW